MAVGRLWGVVFFESAPVVLSCCAPGPGFCKRGWSPACVARRRVPPRYTPCELHLPVSVPVRQSFRHAAFLVNQPSPPQRVGNPQTPLPLPLQLLVPGSVCPDRGPLPLHAAQISQNPPNPDPAHLSMHQAARFSRTGTSISPSGLLPTTR